MSDKHYLSIAIAEYVRPNPLSVANLQVGGPTSNIKLPIPLQLVDTQNLKWQEENLSAVGALAGGAMQEGLSKFVEGQGVSSQGVSMGDLGSAAAIGAGRYLNSASRGITDFALQGAGLALNPLLTLLFRNPEFKRHQFSWNFSPKSRSESKELDAIINKLKNASLPNVTGGGIFFKYPNMLLLRYRDENTTYRFKPTVINSISVNYAASGRPSFFEGPAGETFPSHISLSLDLVEIVLNTKDNSSWNSFSTKSLTIDGLASKGSDIIKNQINKL